jgi:orotate phosphoribosyltransferase
MDAAELARQIEGALIVEGHFRLTAPRYLHSMRYVAKGQLSEKLLIQAAEYLAINSDDSIQIVVAPEEGAVPLGRLTAESLTGLLCQEDPVKLMPTRTPIVFIRAKKYPGGFCLLPEDVERVRGKIVLVVEDILTTGGSARKVVELIREKGGIVIGVSALWNRGSVTKNALGNVPWLYSLIEYPIPTYEKGNSCPGCREGMPLNTNLGHG